MTPPTTSAPPAWAALVPEELEGLAMAQGPGDRPAEGARLRRAVASNSPRGHMLPLLVAVARLAAAGRESGPDVLLYDSSGLVDPDRGGVALKLAEIDLLRPEVVVALSRGGGGRPPPGRPRGGPPEVGGTGCLHFAH